MMQHGARPGPKSKGGWDGTVLPSHPPQDSTLLCFPFDGERYKEGNYRGALTEYRRALDRAGCETCLAGCCGYHS